MKHVKFSNFEKDQMSFTHFSGTPLATGTVATLSSPKQFPFTIFSLITKRFKLEETNYAFSLGGFMERFH